MGYALGSPIAFVIHPEIRNQLSKKPANCMLSEACSLAQAIGFDIVHAEVVVMTKLRAPTYFGKGLVERMKGIIDDVIVSREMSVLIVNTSLSAVQQRNLETQTKAKVIDRTQLILEIFGARAKTHAGRLQVELAALNFQRSRLVRSWTHLERQRGGGGFLGGPGERQIELDRRMLMERVIRIRRELREVIRTRALQRNNRTRNRTPTMVLIGYTNAGKSSLFNCLTGATVLSKDMLFATLDPTMRELSLPFGQKAIVADTVGFISHLPTELVEAFKSTLEEVVYADFLIHVHDASSPMVAEEMADVVKVLNDLGVDVEARRDRIIHLLNKADLLKDEEDIDNLKRMFPKGLFVSAVNGQGVSDALLSLSRNLSKSWDVIKVYLTPADGAARAWLHEHARVERTHFDDAGNETIFARIDTTNHARFCARWPMLKIKKRLER